MLIGLIGSLLSGRFKWLIIFASLLATNFATGWVVHKIHLANELSKLQQIQEKAAEQRKKANELSKQLESALAEEKAKRIAIEGKLRYELQNPAYSCVVPPSGVQLLRDAVGSPSS